VLGHPHLPASAVLSVDFRAFGFAGGESMHKQLLSGTATLAATALVIIAMASPAAARIECRGNFQVTKYGLISTPYCEEEQIARVARSYGSKVTGAEVRNNPLTKVYLCQIYGYDIRLKGSCAGYAPELYGR
jgi:hypothetical protein